MEYCFDLGSISTVKHVTSSVLKMSSNATFGGIYTINLAGTLLISQLKESQFLWASYKVTSYATSVIINKLLPKFIIGLCSYYCMKRKSE